MSRELVKTISGTSLPSCQSEWLAPPSKLYKSLTRIRNAGDALVSGAPTLGMIVREKGRDYAENYLKLWLIDVQASLNIKNKMNEGMIDFCAVAILDGFPSLNIADIKNVLYGAKIGSYGEFYESISTAKVMGWFREYFEQRLTEAEAMSMKDHDMIKKNPPDLPDAILKTIEERNIAERVDGDSGEQDHTSEVRDVPGTDAADEKV